MVEATARDESIQGEWWYSSAHSRPRYYTEVNAHFHSPHPLAKSVPGTNLTFRHLASYI